MPGISELNQEHTALEQNQHRAKAPHRTALSLFPQEYPRIGVFHNNTILGFEALSFRDTDEMSTVTIENIQTRHNTFRHLREDSAVCRIRRGYYARFHSSDKVPLWDLWQAVALSRVFASAALARSERIFTGRSALLLHSIHTWVTNPNVEYWCEDGGRRTIPFASVKFQNMCVPPCAITLRSHKPHTVVRLPDGLAVESVESAVVRIALKEEPLEAFVAACMALHSLSDFSHFALEISRTRVEIARERLFAVLDDRLSHRNYAIAHSILAFADGGCDNIFEAAVLWVVRTLYSGEVVTQFEIYGRYGRYFGDIVIPALQLIIETDGVSKLSLPRSDGLSAEHAWMRRQQDLINLGWKIFRVSWADLEDFPALRRAIASNLGVKRLPPSSECARIWSVPSAECDGPKRRIHTNRHRSTGFVGAVDYPNSGFGSRIPVLAH